MTVQPQELEGRVMGQESLRTVPQLPSISVCIPAHNEARTIASTIRTVINQDGFEATEFEVLVGANACTDATADEVRRMMVAHPDRVRLLEIAAKGKPNAWNELREAARHDILVFIDGDVEVHPSAFARLARMLMEREDLILAQGMNAAVLRECGLITRLIRPRPNAEDGVFIKTWQDHPCGRMYAMKKRGIEEVMNELGFKEMPSDLIHEDGWLRRVLDIAASRHRGVSLEDVKRGQHRYWEVCSEALVYYVPHEWHEDAKIIARTLHARDQLDAMFPDWAAADRKKQKENIEERTVASRIQTLTDKGLIDGLRHLLAKVLRGMAKRKARRQHENDRLAGRVMTSKTFARSESSKRRVGASQALSHE